ncbi:unnamed protein product [Amoebophrya sp. A25]|nr:unnamed protein product [Amoebophrya sp. A25]|eukprot:GSA25T00006147001.1
MEISGLSIAGSATGAAPAAPLPKLSTRPAASSAVSGKAGKKMIRPTQWSPEVEDLHRLQKTGWNTVAEYEETNGPLDRWTKDKCESEFIAKTKIKSSGYFVYWRRDRECTEADVKKVKIYA